MKNKSKKLLSSKEVVKMAKIKDCDLMHHRLKGDLEFEKKGNAYFYTQESVEKLRNFL